MASSISLNIPTPPPPLVASVVVNSKEMVLLLLIHCLLWLPVFVQMTLVV